MSRRGVRFSHGRDARGCYAETVISTVLCQANVHVVARTPARLTPLFRVFEAPPLLRVAGRWGGGGDVVKQKHDGTLTNLVAYLSGEPTSRAPACPAGHRRRDHRAPNPAPRTPV